MAHLFYAAKTIEFFSSLYSSAPKCAWFFVFSLLSFSFCSCIVFLIVKSFMCSLVALSTCTTMILICQALPASPFSGSSSWRFTVFLWSKFASLTLSRLYGLILLRRASHLQTGARWTVLGPRSSVHGNRHRSTWWRWGQSGRDVALAHITGIHTVDNCVFLNEHYWAAQTCLWDQSVARGQGRQRWWLEPMVCTHLTGVGVGDGCRHLRSGRGDLWTKLWWVSGQGARAEANYGLPGIDRDGASECCPRTPDPPPGCARCSGGCAKGEAGSQPEGPAVATSGRGGAGQ